MVHYILKDNRGFYIESLTIEPPRHFGGYLNLEHAEYACSMKNENNKINWGEARPIDEIQRELYNQ